MSTQSSQRSADLLEDGKLMINNHVVRFTEKKENWQAFASDGIDNTGYAVWDGGVVLALYLDCCLGSSLLTQVTAIELGCGTGVAGISLAVCGANVILSDLEYVKSTVVSNILDASETLELVGSKADFVALDWRLPLSVKLKECSMVIAADCLWQEESVRPFFRTLQALLSTSTSKIQLKSCACQLDHAQEYATQAESVAAQMGFTNPLSDRASRRCSELEWATDLIREQVPFALLTYSFRKPEVHKLMMSILEAEFCWSKVPSQRVPGSNFINNNGERDFSEESVPCISIFRIQLPCQKSMKSKVTRLSRNLE